MLITAEGIVLHERMISESDKFIDFLTKDYGIIEISVKGARKITSKNSAATQLFAYSKLCIQKKGERYYLNSSEIIRSFYNIRTDLKKLALASYFSELLKYSIQSEQPSNDILRLTLNSFHFLELNKHSEEQLKSIFELRLVSDIGIMPDILACKKCAVYENDEMYFLINEGTMLCRQCFNKTDGLTNDVFVLNKAVLHIVRYIVLSELDKIWKFKVSDETQSKLNDFSEKYITSHFDRHFKTLDFYHTI
ncbi:MAG TPA: DNA repair protein RecO [Oscillospiraceae bacterium]|nr:DNA repair protein RecO [Oscillospiraceae bacterium]